MWTWPPPGWPAGWWESGCCTGWWTSAGCMQSWWRCRLFSHTLLVSCWSFAVVFFFLLFFVFLPARDRYQQASSVCSLFQMAAPMELTRAMTSRMPNRTRICMLVTRSTLERFSGALVEFWGKRGGSVSGSERCWTHFFFIFFFYIFSVAAHIFFHKKWS